jgi:hypothetical protein
MAAWLNGDPIFYERALAYVDEAKATSTNAGKLAIRSRGIAKLDEEGNVVEKHANRSVQVVPRTLSTTTLAAANVGADAAGDTLAIAFFKGNTTTAVTTFTARDGGAAGATEFNCQTSTTACAAALQALIVANPIANVTTSITTNGIVTFSSLDPAGIVVLTVTNNAGKAFGTVGAGSKDELNVLMFNDWAIKTAGGADSVRRMIADKDTNPKAVFATDKITYTLDPVDDLLPGTYVIETEYANRGRGPTNAAEPPYTDYRAPSVGMATFNVKQTTAEKPVAAGCDACHWAGETTTTAGAGFMLDFPRHNKYFNSKALDQCGGCHDYLSGQKADALTPTLWEGAISKRVHAVHNGANLNYPTITVGHEETAAFGRNWRITYPQNVRNCESCHAADATSGSWMDGASRIPCMGCHDSDAATAHFKAMTYDPTPLAPWSGDEKETCKACH